jgi:hypothetical protein
MFKDMKKAKRGRKHYVVKKPTVTVVSPVAQQLEAAKALMKKKTAPKRKASASFLLNAKFKKK